MASIFFYTIHSFAAKEHSHSRTISNWRSCSNPVIFSSTARFKCVPHFLIKFLPFTGYTMSMVRFFFLLLVCTINIYWFQLCRAWSLFYLVDQQLSTNICFNYSTRKPQIFTWHSNQSSLQVTLKLDWSKLWNTMYVSFLIVTTKSDIQRLSFLVSIGSTCGMFLSFHAKFASKDTKTWIVCWLQKQRRNALLLSTTDGTRSSTSWQSVTSIRVLMQKPTRITGRPVRLFRQLLDGNHADRVVERRWSQNSNK